MTSKPDLSAVEFVSPLPSDGEDVVWALQTAETLWSRGEPLDALVWVRRAAQTANDDGDGARGAELEAAADSLAAQVVSTKRKEESPISTRVPALAKPAPPNPLDAFVQARISDRAPPVAAEARPPLPVPAPAPRAMPPLPGANRVPLTPARPALRPLGGAPPLPTAARGAPPPLPSRGAPPPLPTAARTPGAPPLPRAGVPPLPRPAPQAPAPLPTPDVRPLAMTPFVATEEEIEIDAETPDGVAAIAPRESVEIEIDEEPAISMEEPAVSIEEPAISIEEPAISIEEPAISIEEPAVSIEEPAISIEEPAVSIEEPAVSIEEPAVSMAEPVLSQEVPLVTEPEGAVSVEEASVSVEEPAASVEEASVSVEEPAASVEEPVAEEPAGPTVDLAPVEAFADLPDDVRERLAARAAVVTLHEGESVPLGALGYLVAGSVDVTADTVDAPVHKLRAGDVLLGSGTVEPENAVRVFATEEGATVALWEADAVTEALTTCSWVFDELREKADPVQARVGLTLGPLGQRVDSSLLAPFFDQLEVKAYAAGETVVEAGARVPGLAILAVGAVSLAGEALAVGGFLFPEQVLSAGKCPVAVVAGPGGATFFIADRMKTQELLATAPFLIEILAGM